MSCRCSSAKLFAQAQAALSAVLRGDPQFLTRKETGTFSDIERMVAAVERHEEECNREPMRFRLRPGYAEDVGREFAEHQKAIPK